MLILVAALAAPAAPAGAHPGPHARIESLTLALDRRPDDAGLWIERAVEHHLDGDFAAALRDLDRAESLAPGRAQAARVRATILLTLGRAAEAERELTRALRVDPASADAHRLRGRARMALGRPAAAAADFERGMQLSPQLSPDDYLEWSRALASPPAARADEALAVLERGLVALGPCAALVEEGVRLECARGAWDAALARIERHAVAWGPGAARRARRGDVLLAAGRGIEAEAEYSAALAEIEAAPRRRAATAASLETRLRTRLRQGSPVSGDR